MLSIEEGANNNSILDLLHNLENKIYSCQLLQIDIQAIGRQIGYKREELYNSTKLDGIKVYVEELYEKMYEYLGLKLYKK